MGADESQIEASFGEAIRIATELKSVSCRSAPQQPTRNTADKRRAVLDAVDFDCLFGDYSERAVSRFGCGKSSVIKQTLEFQSEHFVNKRSAKGGVLGPGVSGWTRDQRFPPD
jgi:hypothetical protein